MNTNKEVVHGVAIQVAMYLEALEKLTLLLDQENALLMFEESESQVLRNEQRQKVKDALYKRIDSLARIVTRTLQVGSHEEIRTISRITLPVETFRRSLRLNTVLLEMTIERQQRRMQRIISAIEHVKVPYVADHSL